MGTPKIVIEFLKKSATLIKRSGRGMAVLLLEDSTQEQAMNPYMGIDEVAKEDWTEKNYDYIKMAFKAEPSRVLCVRAVMKDEGMDVRETLELVRYINFDYLTSPYFKKFSKLYFRNTGMLQLKKSGMRARRPRQFWQNTRQTVRLLLILRRLQ